MNLISTELDDFLKEEVVRKPLWYAELSDGRVVIQDDGHPDRTGSSWLRLKEYLASSEANIIKVWLGFRGLTKRVVPDDAAGYFFVNGASAVPGGPTIGHYVFGWVDWWEKDIVHIHKLKVPECTEHNDGDYLRPSEKCNIGLIWNKTKSSLVANIQTN